VQNTSKFIEINVNTRDETRRPSRKREGLSEKMYEPETNSRMEKLIDLYRCRNNFKTVQT
jgi:hypothetical protein